MDHELPPGRDIVPEEQDDGRAALWLSDGPATPGLWARLRADHPRTGRWPLLLAPLDHEDADFRPWGNGELEPESMTSPDQHDAAAVLAHWWSECIEFGDDGKPTPEGAEIIAPHTAQWPGLAAAPTRHTDPEHAADELATALLTADGAMRLGLVTASRGADALTLAGWMGPLNHVGDTAKISAVLRDWEHRFGVRVVGVGFDTLFLSVAAPPTTSAAALHVAAEHFAFCPDNIHQADTVSTIAEYAEQLVNDPFWAFWWD